MSTVLIVNDRRCGFPKRQLRPAPAQVGEWRRAGMAPTSWAGWSESDSRRWFRPEHSADVHDLVDALAAAGARRAAQKHLMPAHRAKGGTKALRHGGRSRRSYTTGWPSSERQGTGWGAEALSSSEWGGTCR
jgi:hypothetical protein